MSRGPQSFKQGDVTKILRGAEKAGLAVERVEVDRDGKIVIFTGERRYPDGNEENEWDTVK
jgi:hypothetical protein